VVVTDEQILPCIEFVLTVFYIVVQEMLQGYNNPNTKSEKQYMVCHLAPYKIQTMVILKWQSSLSRTMLNGRELF